MYPFMQAFRQHTVRILSLSFNPIAISFLLLIETERHSCSFQADLHCLRRLLSAKNAKWDFYLNPAASELPIHGAEHIRRRLATYRGNRSLMVSAEMPSMFNHRMNSIHMLQRFRKMTSSYMFWGFIIYTTYVPFFGLHLKAV